MTTSAFRRNVAPRRWALLLGLALLALPQPALAQSRAGGPPLDRWLGDLGRPFIIGIAGDSGSGKSTFARNLTATLGAHRVKTICVDDYHKLDRLGRKAKGITALNPRANDLGRLARDLGQLRQGRAIDKPVYDHSNGTLATAERFTPAPIIVVEGLHPFATDALRKQVDLAIFFDPTSGVKDTWKIKRDVGERGHSVEAVRKSIRERKPDYCAYVQPQRSKADVVVRFDWSRRDGGAAAENAGLAVKLSERGLIPTKKTLRFDRSQTGYVLRGTRRRNGTAMFAIDGKVPDMALGKLDRLNARVTGVTGQHERRSETLDAARALVASRVLREIARAGRTARGRATTPVRRQAGARR
jgi:uridine kinase